MKRPALHWQGSIRRFMFGFSPGDWLFIALVMITIFCCVAISDMRKKK